MKRSEILQNLDDDQSAWMAYFSELWLHEKKQQNRSDFLPSPADITRRCRELRWLEQSGFCPAAIESIMWDDCPVFSRVVQLVERHGAPEAIRRCMVFAEVVDGGCELMRRIEDGGQPGRIPEAEREGRGAEIPCVSCRRRVGGGDEEAAGGWVQFDRGG